MEKIKLPKYIEMKGFLSLRILGLLNDDKMCGDELASEIGKFKGNKLTPGTIYPTLKQLRKYKLVSRKKEGRKKVYELTSEGKKELKKMQNLLKIIIKKIKK
jgi:DNA-binding PadR family transcriptional regulator